MVAALLVVPALAVLAPLLTRALSRWVAVPIVVFELLLGIVAGPSGFGWTQPSAFLNTLSQLGLAMLFFIAGSEIEFGAFRGRTGARAVAGWILSLGLGLVIGWIVAPGHGAIIIGVALCSTALGTLLPVLRDAGELGTPFGRAAAALGAVGEFGPLLAISVFLGVRAPGPASIVLLVFAVIAVVVVWLSVKIPRGALHAVISATLHTSGQFAVRVVFLILGALLAVSILLGVDMLLGAFTAGVVWRLLMRDADHQHRLAVESKLEGIAFGFLVPLFFIYTGVTFDLDALRSQPVLFGFVGVVAVTLLIVRGAPSMLAAPAGSVWSERVAVGLLGATGLPIIVAATAIGVRHQVITSATASVLVGAGMLSVLLFPLLAMRLHARSRRVGAAG